eukprot:768647-Hanusia_phi.AAC.7
MEQDVSVDVHALCKDGTSFANKLLLRPIMDGESPSCLPLKLSLPHTGNSSPALLVIRTNALLTAASSTTRPGLLLVILTRQQQEQHLDSLTEACRKSKQQERTAASTSRGSRSSSSPLAAKDEERRGERKREGSEGEGGKEAHDVVSPPSWCETESRRGSEHTSPRLLLQGSAPPPLEKASRPGEQECNRVSPPAAPWPAA